MKMQGNLKLYFVTMVKIFCSMQNNVMDRVTAVSRILLVAQCAHLIWQVAMKRILQEPEQMF